MSELSILPTPLPMLVRNSPVIVIATPVAREPETRTIEYPLTRRDGETVVFRFKGEVWRFRVAEVLKDAPGARPEGEIEVVDYALERAYAEQAASARGKPLAHPPAFYKNLTEYAENIAALGGRAAVLFLDPPMAPPTYSEPFREAFGRAYRMTAWPGLDDPARRDRILEIMRLGLR